MSNYNPKFTDDEIIRRVNDVMEVKNVFGRHAYFHAFGLHVRELTEIWVKKPENMKTASFGQSWGYAIGMDNIDRYYGSGGVVQNQRELDGLCKSDPTIENIPENRGIGMMLIHALTTPYIEISGDGKTAQGLWYAPGQVTGPRMATYMDEKYAVDFVKEDGEWKIWHMFVGTDFSVAPGKDLSDQDTPLEQARKADDRPMGPPPGEEDPNPCFIRNDNYSVKFNVPEYPPIPAPYYTFANAVSYGPEGNPNFKGEA